MDGFNNNNNYTPNTDGGENPRQQENAQPPTEEHKSQGANYSFSAEEPESGFHEEQRTPYQTRVRPENYQNEFGGQQRQDSQQYDNNRKSENQQQWQQYGQSQQYYSQQQPPFNKPPKKKRSRVVTVLCGVAAACLLFAGGAVIGHVALGTGSSSDTRSSSQPASGDMPTVEITAKPDADNYDARDGMAGEDIYKKVSPSIVSVLSATYNGTGSGSGVIMTEDGYIITNNHVVEDAQQVTVQLSDGTQMDAKIIGTDEKTDLAVLKVEPSEKLVAAEFGNSDALQPGEYAYAIGSPGGVELANTITGGRISAINRDITIDDRVMTLIQTDASINPGNSGGALINKYGQVVGITSAKLSSSGFGSASYEGLGFAIPMSTAKGVVDELIANGYIAGRPSIGITGQNISAQRAQASNLPQGVYIRSVDSRAHAAQEGLLPGDIITKVDGKDITTMDEINKIKETKKAGDKLTLQVYRMNTGKMVDLSITLTDEHDLADDNTQQSTQQIPQQGDNGYSQYDEDPFSYFFGW